MDMELREPPRTEAAPRPDRLSRVLLVLALLLLIGLWLVMLLPQRRQADSRQLEQQRLVAAKLQAAGALDEAAVLYEAYLASSPEPAEARANIAFSLGTNYLKSGRYEKALRWFYEAETLGAGELSDELASRIVHCLDRLGQPHLAQAAIEGRVELESPEARRPADDPVVARIGSTEIRRSELLRALDELPPDLAAALSEAGGHARFLNRYVAQELLWRKAQKLELDRDPEVERQHAQALKQLAVARFVEREILAKIEVDEDDLRNFLAANLDRYTAEGEEPPSFDIVRTAVEQDYRLRKMQAAYDELIEAELAVQGVQLFPERLNDGE